MSGQQIEGIPTVGPSGAFGTPAAAYARIRGDGLEAVDAREHRHECQRIPAAQRLGAPGMRMVGDAVAAADDGGIGHLIREAETRRKELLAEAHAVVLRDAALPADQRLVGRGVVRFDAQAARTPPVRIELPPQSQVDGQLRSGAPAVANVERVLVFEAVHLDELAALPRARRRAEQKRRPGRSSRSRTTACLPGIRPSASSASGFNAVTPGSK